MAHPQNNKPSSEIYLGSGAVASFEGPDGMPAVHLVEQVINGRTLLRFCHDDTGRLTTATDRRLRAVGLWAFEIRGLKYHAGAHREGDFRPGLPVTIVREFDNPHDPNAVGIAAAGSRDIAGYVNKAAAKRVAGWLDAGQKLEGVSMEGDAPGKAERVVVLIAERSLVRHVMGPRPSWAAKPAHWA